MAKKAAVREREEEDDNRVRRRAQREENDEDTGREVATQANREISTETANYFESYGASLQQSNIVGKLLKFNKGDWLVGEDEDELPEGTQIVCHLDSLLIGWQKWENHKPTEQRMGLLSEGFKPPSRDKLGDDDESEWETDNKGETRDPWQFTNYLVVKFPGSKNRDLMTYAASSRGGLNAIGALCTLYSKEMRQRPGQFPIVELGDDYYDHPNKEYGRIKIPVLKVVGWEKKDLFPKR